MSTTVPHPHGQAQRRQTNDHHAKRKRPFDLNRQRRRDIARLVVHRHGRLAKAALCIPYAAAAAWHCPSDSERRLLMAQWCYWTCALPSIECNIDTILQDNPPRRMSADTLARHLHVSDAERTLLRVYTIGAYDVPKAARIKRRKEKRRLAAQARRRAKGTRSREQVHAEALAKAEQWKAKGVSRRTWYRQRQIVAQSRGHA